MRLHWSAFVIFALFLLAAVPSPWQVIASSNGGADPGADPGYFASWFSRVDRTQAEQPHWATPLATTTPRLEEEFRFDTFWQTNNSGITTENYGGAKGLELIPAERVEVILVAPPAYIVHNNPAAQDGFGDWGFLVKYRILRPILILAGGQSCLEERR